MKDLGRPWSSIEPSLVDLWLPGDPESNWNVRAPWETVRERLLRWGSKLPDRFKVV